MEIKNQDIITDTREQLKLWPNTVVKKLDAGDYSIVGYEDKFAIERKSMADLVGTLTSGHARFKRELDRTSQMDYFAIVVEEPYSHLTSQRWKGSVYTRIKGKMIAAICNTLRVKYNIQIIFCSNRAASKTEIKGLMDAYLRVQEKVNKEKVKEKQS